jgi:ABC-type Fe3+-hydroxamate transport system substrate-binding protein
MLAAGCGPTDPAVAPAESAGPAHVAPLVVSLSPVASRFVLALEAGHLLLGVDAASAGIPGLADLPAVDLAGAAGLAPDLVLVPSLPDAGDPAARELRESGVEVVEFQPHTLEDVALLCRSVGAQLAGEARATRFELDLNLPLALVGGDSSGQPRPRVVAVTRTHPLELAGGHSFETDLIEIAGGSSVTHGIDELRLVIPPERWAELAPDLLLVTGATEPTPAERQRAEAALPAGYRVAFFAFDRDFFWLGDAAADARRLRALIAPLARELAQRAPAAEP